MSRTQGKKSLPEAVAVIADGEEYFTLDIPRTPASISDDRGNRLEYVDKELEKRFSDISSSPFVPSYGKTIFPKVNEAGAKSFLTKNKWPIGLQNALIKSCKKVPIRFFIVDDSGSMLTVDGQKWISSETNAR